MNSTIEPTRKLLVVTDAWKPQINGVAQTYAWLERELPSFGVAVEMLTPQAFPTFPIPTYPEIRLARTSTRAIGAILEAAKPDMVHIATEGPLGWRARRHCLRSGRQFTTCYHTRYPEYIAARFPVPLSATYAVLRRFHNAAAATMVVTPGLGEELRLRGFQHVRHWRRGVDTALFAEGPAAEFVFPRPWFLYVGRIAVEKNLVAFLQLDLPGTKLLVGDGPAHTSLQRKYPDAQFTGPKYGAELAAIYRAADVFVFPSKTDTFGLVMAEALAAGTPVAAYPGSGAAAIIGNSRCGIMHEDLRYAALKALEIDTGTCRRAGVRHSIQTSARCFLSILEEIGATG